MENEKIVLQSPESLKAGKNHTLRFFVISFCVGFALGAVSGLTNDTFDLMTSLVLGVLVMLVGWGIRNKIMSYKSYGLRQMSFLIDEKPPYSELYQRLLPVFQSMNVRIELIDNAKISVFYKGLCYDVVYNKNDTFSVLWHEGATSTVVRSRFNVSIYGKVLDGMGFVAYYVQRCLFNSGNAAC